MGVVYLAEQEAPLRRRVALKVIKPGMDSKQVLARFEAERQALALMNHPGVAKVFDAGSTLEGRPYFVMAHVAGISITKYCDKNFWISGKDSISSYKRARRSSTPTRRGSSTGTSNRRTFWSWPRTVGPLPKSLTSAWRRRRSSN